MYICKVRSPPDQCRLLAAHCTCAQMFHLAASQTVEAGEPKQCPYRRADPHADCASCSAMMCTAQHHERALLTAASECPALAPCTRIQSQQPAPSARDSHASVAARPWARRVGNMPVCDPLPSVDPQSWRLHAQLVHGRTAGAPGPTLASAARALRRPNGRCVETKFAGLWSPALRLTPYLHFRSASSVSALAAMR